VGRLALISLRSCVHELIVDREWRAQRDRSRLDRRVPRTLRFDGLAHLDRWTSNRCITLISG